MKSMPALFALGSGGLVTVWNSSDKSADITLSGTGSHVATRNSGASSNRAVRGVTSKDYTSNGYFEILVSAMQAPGYVTFGIATSSASLSNYVGSDAYGWSYAATGEKANNGSLTSYGSPFVQGAVIGVAFKNGKVWFAENNTWNGDPAAGTGEAFSGITGTLFPMVALYYGGVPQDSISGKFSTGSFTYSPPSGFSAWDPS